jgi:ubiquinone/menaquinone biosynthesis C-methylase UbiE
VASEELESWESNEYALAWAGEDVLSDLLALPVRISVALAVDAGLQVQHVVDVGAGPGTYLQAFLSAFPEARGIWIDSSEAMEELARERLDDRVTYVQADAEKLDEIDLPPAQVVTTSRMLHHFDPEGIRRFYSTVNRVLEPGGFFFNLDHYGTPDGWEARYRRIREQFTGGRKRKLRPHRHDYPFSPIREHLAWLADAGFEAPDVPWRTFFTALVAARKPG